MTTTAATATKEETAADAVAAAKHNDTTSFAKRALLATNFFVETNRMEPFLAVYYITYIGWDSWMIGIISLATNITMILFQTPAGDLLDRTSYKKEIMAVAVLTASVTTACVAWTSTFWVVLTAKILEGFASTIFLPGLMTLLLGICVTEKEVPSFVAQTEVANKVGSVLFTLGCGIITWFLYPNITSMFYLLGAGGLLSALSISLIPNSAIDDNRARKLTAGGDDDDDDDDNKDEDGGSSSKRNFEVIDISVELNNSDKKDRSIKEVLESADLNYDMDDVDIFLEKNGDRNNAGAATASLDTASLCSSSSGTTTTKTATKSSSSTAQQPKRYADLIRDRYILAFAAATFLYHLSNAAIAPLVAQFTAKIGDERESMVFVSAIMLVFYFSQGVTAQWMIKATNKYDHKRLMIAAFAILPIQGIVLALLVNFWNNKYALTATQILVGVSAGIFDTMIPIVVGTMTAGTGRVGLAYGFALTMWRFGHGCSVLLGEAVVHAFDYSVAFIAQGAIGVVALAVLIAFVRFDTQNNEESKKRQQQQQQQEQPGETV
jgi:MFS family permease